MPRVRPTEHKAVMALLDAPAESVAELATDVIMAIDDLRSKRSDWVVVVRDPGTGVFVWGPFITKNAALKAIERAEIFASKPGATAFTRPLITSADEGIEV